MRERTCVVAVFIALSAASSWAASSKPRLELSQQPIAFQPNRGQTDKAVQYLARGNGYVLFLNASEAVLRLRHPSNDSVLRVAWVGANPSTTLQAEGQLPGRVNYFRGKDPSKWLTDIETFRKLRMSNIYDGVDLVFYGNQRQLEYDFVVAPGADPSQIRLAFEGAEQIRIDPNGDLVLTVKGGELKHRKPIVYQQVDGKKKMIEGRFLLGKGNIASFKLGEFDRSKPLVIDPTLSYSTFLGGSNLDVGFSIAVDSSGRAYVTGITDSTNFPFKGSVQGSNRGSFDAFVTKMWATGGGVIYSTYLGGSLRDEGNAIAVDRFGNAYVAGFTSSADFPVTPGAFQSPNSDKNDGFVTKLSPGGSSLVYSLMLGGGDLDVIEALALDSQQRAYVTGFTCSSNPSNFPVKNAFQSASHSQNCANGGGDAFLTRFNASGSALDYSTYLGGSFASGSRGIAVDSSFQAYVTGFTDSPDFPATPGVFQATLRGDFDAFVTKFSTDGRSLVYSTYLGGSFNDRASGIAIDSSRRAYVTGFTRSNNLPTTSGAFDRTFGGDFDGFVTKLNTSGSALMYSTYLGGSRADIARSIAVNSAGHAHVTGVTGSSNFPVKNAIDSTYNGFLEVFVSKLWATGGGLHYSTFLGGTADDEGFAIRLDANNNAYLTGLTRSLNFRTTTGAYRRTHRGDQDAFVAKIAP